MATCLNTNTVEYRSRLKMSGMSEFSFNAFASKFVESNGRYPELDELPNANSRPYLNKALNITSEDTVNNSKLLEYTKTDDLGKANIELNKLYRDLEIKIIPIIDQSKVDVKERPTKWRGIYEGGIDIDSTKSPQRDAGVISNIAERLATLYGINMKTISNSELAMDDKWKDIVADARTVNGFIYQGDIYLNVDNMQIDTPLHEMLHLILGSTRFTDPALYTNLVNSMEQAPMYQDRAMDYMNRTRMDINEEILVSEMSKYMTGQNSLISKLDKKTLNKLYYNMNRLLDSAVFGKQSVSTLDSAKLFNSSLLKLSRDLGSELTNNSYTGTIDLNAAETHRIMANVKSSLMEQGKLKEYC